MVDTGMYDFSDFITDRTTDFTGREWVFAEIERWLADSGLGRVLLLTGGPGTGKSAVAARLVQIGAGEVQIEGSRYLQSGVVSYAHFCHAKEDTTLDALHFVESLASNLASHHETFRQALQAATDPNVAIHIAATQTIGTVTGGTATNVAVTIQGSGISARAAFVRLVRRPLEQIYGAGFNGAIVVLVDALDEALTYGTGSDIVTLLRHVLDDPKGLPRQVRFILTCRSNEKRVLDVITGERIDLIDHAPPSSMGDVSKYAHRRLVVLVEPKRKELADRIAAKSNGNFLYARFVLDDLLAPGRPLRDPDTLELPDKLEDAYHQFLEREVGADTTRWRDTYRPVLAALVVARGSGLTRQQILDIAVLSESAADDVLRTCGQFLAPSPPQGPFRFYHESFREYLQSSKDLAFLVYPAEAHAAIGRFFVSEHSANWRKCADQYALQYTPHHLMEAARGLASTVRQRALVEELHRLLLDSGFGSVVTKYFQSPLPFLNDLRLGLGLALEKDDIVQIWRYADRYQRVLQQERQPAQAVADTQAGNFEEALERTSLFGAMPNSQAMLRLWIAWHAATVQQTEISTRAATLALGGLPPQGFVSGVTEEVDPGAAYTIRNALSTVLQQLLLRLARAISAAGEDPAVWLHRVATSWRSEDVEAVVARLDEQPNGWASTLAVPTSEETLDDLLRQLQGSAASADHPMNFREAAYVYQHRLAAALYHERANAFWQWQVSEVVSRLSLDDYPSYREMALAWIAVAVLCHEDDTQALQALSTVLVGALGIPEPGFGGEAVVAVLHGLAHEAGRAFKTDGLTDALKYVGSTTKVPTQVSLRMEAGLPTDPWAFELLRRNAVAASLHRQGHFVQAELALDEAAQLGRDDSYAGYRVLARLSLACRWLEWDRSDKAAALLALAREDATHMLDKVLGHEREGLVDELERWLGDLGDRAPELVVAGEVLRHTGDLVGMVRALRIQFLAALWSEQPELLKRLVPLALTDVTAMDAVLGRLFAQWGKEMRADRPFERLAHAMNIDFLEPQFLVGE